MKIFKQISVLLLTVMLMISCNDEASIQQFYVDSETNENYLMLDIPTSVVSLPDNVSDEAKQAYNSIDKINLLAFKVNETNKVDYQSEKLKVKKILKDSKYIELMRLNSNGRNIIAKYVGDENSVEELILFASDKHQGFALARVLGEDMKPENMLKLLNSLKDIDKDSDVLKKMEAFFK